MSGTKHPCPSCDRTFPSLRSVATHHWQAHPDGWEDYFWSRVDVGKEDECWIFKGKSVTDYGHALMTHRQKMKYVHRIAYELEYEHPGDMQVNHHCDTPNCANPNHLYLGDQSDNIKDMWRRERRDIDDWRGEASPKSKLTQEQVEEIRGRIESESYAKIAEDYPVTASTIGSIAAGSIWSYDDS